MTLRERYEKETGLGICDDEIGWDYTEWLESIATKYFERQKTKAHLFVDSEWFDFEKFATEMALNHGWTMHLSGYYYEAMKEWSTGLSGDVKHKKLDWHLVALAWERKDKRQGTGYYFKKFDKAEEKRKQQIEAMK